MYVSCANLYENVHACIYIYIHIGWCTLKIHLLLETSCLMECSNVPCTNQEMTKSSSICFLIKIEERDKKKKNKRKRKEWNIAGGMKIRKLLLIFYSRFYFRYSIFLLFSSLNYFLSSSFFIYASNYISMQSHAGGRFVP